MKVVDRRCRSGVRRTLRGDPLARPRNDGTRRPGGGCDACQCVPETCASQHTRGTTPDSK